MNTQPPGVSTTRAGTVQPFPSLSWEYVFTGTRVGSLPGTA